MDALDADRNGSVGRDEFDDAVIEASLLGKPSED